MRTLTWWLMGSALVTALGCSGGGSSPTTPSTTGDTSFGPIPGPAAQVATDAALGAVVQRGDLQEGAAAIYTLEVDPGTLTATSHLKEVRAGQQNDDLYMLPLNGFFKKDSFTVTGVTSTIDTLDVTYEIKHPFVKPSNLDGTPHALLNRSDLAVAGMTLFLANAPAAGNTYFTNRVANTKLVANADAYFAPEGTITLAPAVTANIFPYKQLVDEQVGGVGSRVNVSNLGAVTGNYGLDGWSRADMTANRDGWTGYGVLHQGQTSENTVSFNKTELGAGLSLEIALIVKYNDPRGGTTSTQKRANRLPPVDPPNHLIFMYRMPHGALDVGKIIFDGQTGNFLPGNVSSATLSFRVEDWDAKGMITGAPDLSEDATPTNINALEVGEPTLEVCIPGVIGTATTVSPIAIVPGAETGQPGSELVYSALVSKTAVDDGPNAYVGMARASDPEAALPTPLVTAVDGNLAAAVPAPMPVTYQSFPVPLGSFNAAPTATVSGPGGTLASGNGVLTLTVNPYNDADLDPIDIRFDWNNDGDFADTGEAYQTLDGTPPDAFNSPIFYINTTLTPEARSVPYDFTDNVIAVPITGSASFTLGPNQAPVIAGAPVLNLATVNPNSLFRVLAGTATAPDPEGDAVTYFLTGSVAPTGPFPSAAGQATFPIDTGRYPLTGPVTVRVYARDALHGNSTPAQPDSASAYAPLAGNVMFGGWVYTSVNTNTGLDQANSLALDSMNNVYIGGQYNGVCNFGGGNRTAAGASQDIFIVKMDPTGQYLWDRVIGSTNTTFTDFLTTIQVDPSDNPVAMVHWAGTLPLTQWGGVDQTSNGTVTAGNFDMGVVRMSAANGSVLGLYRTNDTANSTRFNGATHAHSMDINAAGEIVMAAVGTGGATVPTTMDAGVGTPYTFTIANEPMNFVVKLSSATTPVPLWFTTLGAPPAPTAAATNGASSGFFMAGGDVIVGGIYTNNFNFGGGARTVVGGAGSDNFVTRRSGVTGARVWDTTWGATTSDFLAGGEVDATNVYFGGQWQGSLTWPAGGPVAEPSVASLDAFVCAFNLASGAFVWRNNYQGTDVTNGDIFTDITVSGGNVYAAGRYSGTLNFGGGPRVTAGSQIDACLIKLTTAGAYVYDKQWGAATTGAELWLGLAADSGGNPYMTGVYAGTVDMDPGPPVVNRTAGAGNDVMTVCLQGSTGNF